MPLYMDFHIFPEITIEDVKNAHLADKAVQDQYQVKYHQFWVNEAAGTVYCLIEGPDKESCEAVHQEAHGNVACKIVEVESGFFNLFMGENHQVDHGLVRHENGAVDTGYRFVLVIDIIGNTSITSSVDYKDLKLPEKPKRLAMGNIHKFQGEVVKNLGDDSIIAVFIASDDVVRCAVEIYNEFIKKSKHPADSEWDISFKMGISGGQPVTESDGFFEEAIKLGQRLSLIAGNNEIMASTLIEKLSNFNEIAGGNQSMRVISPLEEKFLGSLFDITDNNLSDHNFSVESLSRDIGISRPQLYRKIISITGLSPNGFIRDLRMQKALSLIKEKQYNISEIALEVGYNNPSYFSKCFQEKYGIIPSKAFPGPIGGART